MSLLEYSDKYQSIKNVFNQICYAQYYINEATGVPQDVSWVAQKT